MPAKDSSNNSNEPALSSTAPTTPSAAQNVVPASLPVMTSPLGPAPVLGPTKTRDWPSVNDTYRDDARDAYLQSESAFEPNEDNDENDEDIAHLLRAQPVESPLEQMDHIDDIDDIETEVEKWMGGVHVLPLASNPASKLARPPLGPMEENRFHAWAQVQPRELNKDELRVRYDILVSKR